MKNALSLALLGLVFGLSSSAWANETPAVEAKGARFVVQTDTLPDPKPVFASVESTDITLARARIGGTVVSLVADEGMLVKKGDVLATVADDKLALQLTASDAQIAGAQAENAKAQEDLQRGRDLFKNGTISKAKIDDLQARADVASNQLKAQQSAKSVVLKQVEEGQVLAPADGRILTVPLTQGAVIMPGEVVARLAADHFILRLKLPERHARALKVNDAVALDGSDLGSNEKVTGKIVKIYPEIEQGRVMADVDVAGLSDYFVGERVRVWITTDTRQGIVVPRSMLFARGGADYVRLLQADGTALDVPVQRGQARTTASILDGVEVLSGLHDGDTLLTPEK